MTEYVMIEKSVYERFLQQEIRIHELEKQVGELKAILHAYSNSNTPSSKQRFKQRRDTPEEPAKRGAPEGHRGATRKIPDPDKFVDTKSTGCKTRNCEGEIFILNSYRKKVLDLIITPTVTEFTIYRCKCLCCGKEFETTDPNLPREGHFGPNYTTLMSALHYKGRIPFENLADASESCFNIGITAKGLQDVVYRTAMIFEPYYKCVGDVIKESKYVRSDETSYPYNREKWWVWNLSNGIEDLVVINSSRGAKVLEEYLNNGKDYDGLLQCDFFKSYQSFKKAKKVGCWRHLTGDSKELSEECGKEGKIVHNELKEMYKEIVELKRKGKEGTNYAELKIKEFHNKFVALSKRQWKHKKVRKFVENRLIYFEDWLFTCMRFKEAEATNNSSERDIRKPVCARNVSGCHRSLLGVHSREIMTSLMLTELHRGNNPIDVIRNGIMQYNSS